VVRGLGKNTSLDQLRVNLRCEHGEDWHQDNVDLYSGRSRQSFVKQAAAELGLPEEVIKRDMGKLLRALEELQERLVREAHAPKRPEVQLSEQEREEALELLKDPRLIERILAGFDQCGIVGERTGKLLGYLSATSRLLEQPLHVLIQSSSAAGKSSLMEAVLSFMPPESVQKYSAMTGQSLFYFGEKDLSHKILSIAEEQGAQKASYALKLLLSEGRLSIASTGKDPLTGKLLTHEYFLLGPIVLFITSAAVEIEEELINRCLVLAVDESRQQTRAIHQLQRHGRSLEGLWARERKGRVVALHQNAQRLLQPLEVVNPYERYLTFLDDRTRTRRDQVKYLTLIDAIALLHQHQRPVKSSSRYGQEKLYIEATLSDIELATELAHEVLGRSLDELPPQTRRFVSVLEQMASEACQRQAIERSEYRFTQREAREYSGWSDFQVKAHLRKLAELEYVLVHRSGRGQSFVYELLYRGEGKDGGPFLMGLIDVAKLREQLRGHGYEEDREHFSQDREHPKEAREPSGSYEGAPREHPGSIEQKADVMGQEAAFSAAEAKNAQGAGIQTVPSEPVEAPRNGKRRS
jgi:hypothetical protein